MRMSRRTPPPRAAAPARTSTPNRSRPLLRPPRVPRSGAKAKTPTRSRAQLEGWRHRGPSTRRSELPLAAWALRAGRSGRWQSRAGTWRYGRRQDVRPATGRRARGRPAPAAVRSRGRALPRPARRTAPRGRPPRPAPARPAADRDRRRHASARGPGPDPGRPVGEEVAERSGLAGREGAALRGRRSSPSASTSRAWPRLVRLRGAGGGGTAPTLSARVSQRLSGRGVDPATAEWDARARRRR